VKKLIIYLVALLFICSCATTKKLTKTDTHTESEFVVQIKDSSTINSSWDTFLSNLEKTIDLSTIHIISYYPQKDSVTGVQLVKEEVTINKNIVTTTEKKNTEKREVIENAKVEINSTEKVKSDVKKEVLQTKGASKFKLYAIIALLLTVLLGSIYLSIKRCSRFH